jgi:hypothetical protein
LDRHGYLDDFNSLDKKFLPQENRYVKLLADVNPYISSLIKNLKLEYYQDRNVENIPLFH